MTRRREIRERLACDRCGFDCGNICGPRRTKMLALREIVRTGKCPRCGNKLVRNSALAGWFSRGKAEGLLIAAEDARRFVIDGEIDCTNDPRKALDVLAEHLEWRATQLAKKETQCY